MRHQTPVLQTPNRSAERILESKHDLLAVYDRYAPLLLGVIMKIVMDKDEAISLLEQTFVKIHSDIAQFQAGKQPLFTWLLSIARCKALEALKERKQVPVTMLTMTTTGKVVPLSMNTTAVPANSPDARLKELLDSVLYKNCTPEEAAAAVGLPVETARQQLRLAMQLMRSQVKK
jgi:DNA-directed RNA polymerase specialized sigma24 family protein